MNRTFIRISMAALAGLATLGFSTDVAAQTTFEACRVPNVGAIYMINVAGAPSACLDASHVMFTWTEGGGTVGPGSITATELADNAVTTAKILDGAITQAKLDAGISIGLNPGDVGTAELANDAVTEAKIAAGAVTGAKIAAGAVGTGQLAADAVDSNAILDGSIGTFDLASTAIIGINHLNANVVNSSKIVDGSVGIADVDDTEVQARVSTSCAPGGAYRQINSDGTAICESTNGHVMGVQSTTISILGTINSTTPTQILSMTVPGSQSGLLTVSGHTVLEAGAGETGQYWVTIRTGSCSGTVIGAGWWRPDANSTGFHSETIPVTGYATGVTSSTTIALCARKHFVSGDDLSIYMSGMVAQW